MAHKKMEGDENQKRQKAREAKAQGKRPSEMNATTGASNQIGDESNKVGNTGGNRGRAEHD